MHRTWSREHSGAPCLQSCRLKGLGEVFGNKNGSGYQSSFSLLSLLVLCSFPWKLLSWESGDWSSEALDKAPGEEARPAIPLQSPFVPAVLTLLVHKHNVTFLQFDLCLALRGVWDHNAVPLEKKMCKDLVNLRLMGASGHQYKDLGEKTQKLLEISVGYIFTS